MTAIKAKFRRKGFTIIELTIAMTLMFALAYLSMNSHTADQTGKLEAERFEIWLARIIQQAIRMRRGFEMSINTAKVQVEWLDNYKKEYFDATSGCTFSSNRSKITYNAATNGFTGGSNCTITVTGSDNSNYYVILSTTGRVRVSDTKSE